MDKGPRGGSASWYAKATYGCRTDTRSQGVPKFKSPWRGLAPARRLSAAARSSLGCGGRRSRALAGVPLTPPCAARLFLPRGPISGWQRLSRERARRARPSGAAGPSPRVPRA